MAFSLGGIESYFFGVIQPLIVSYGGPGIALGMFLESSILPIPSELILITAGLFFDPLTVAIWGAIGSTLGAMVGYYVGFKGGRPVVDRYGPYFLVTRERVDTAEKKFRSWGPHAVLIGRLIPLIPFKVFSITSGILKLNFESFTVMTFIGTLPRAFLLAWLGNRLLQYQSQALPILGAIVLLLIVGYFVKKEVDARRSRKRK